MTNPAGLEWRTSMLPLCRRFAGLKLTCDDTLPGDIAPCPLRKFCMFRRPW
jgi:hypothetical protein